MKTDSYRCHFDTRCECVKRDHGILENCSYLNLTSSPTLDSFVTSINLSHNNLKATPEHGELKSSLLVLDLSFNAIDSFPNRTFSSLHNLKILNLSNNNLELKETVFYVGLFSELNNLYSLDLQNNYRREKIPNIFTPCVPYPETISKLKSLKSLRIDGIPNYYFGPQFSQLPELTSLVMSQSSGFCNLTSIDQNFFRNLPHLTSIDISECSIKQIKNGTFSNLRNLSYLDISRNTYLTFCGLMNVSEDLNHTSIKVLKAQNVYCTIGRSSFVANAFVESLQRTELKELYLDDNKIDFMEYNIAQKMPLTLTTLSLTGNRLTLGEYLYHNVYLLENLKVLDISYQFRHITSSFKKLFLCEDFSYSIRCECKYSADAYPGPQVLTHYRRNPEPNILQTNFSFPSCTRFNPDTDTILELPQNLDEIKFDYSHAGDTIPFLWLASDHLPNVTLRGNSLTKWIGPICNATSITYLDLSENLCSYVDKRFFTTLTGLEKLHLESNYLSDVISNDTDGTLFGNSNNIKILNLKNNRLQKLPNKIFKGLFNLEVLNLGENALIDIEFDMNHMSKVSHIDISSNFIRYFSHSTIESFDKMSQNLTIDMSNNSIICACNTLYFLKWMHNQEKMQSVKFKRLKTYSCQMMIRGTQVIKEFNELDKIITKLEKDCVETKAAVLIAVTLSLVVIIVIIIAFIANRHKWKIRYFLYIAKRELFRKGYEPLRENDTYKYDAFISYAEGDRTFVIDNLFRHLHMEFGFQLCLHDKDFIPGSDIADNIIGAIRNSRKVIFVVSAYFVKSDWCMYEFNMANLEERHSRRIKSLIFIFKGDVPIEKLPLQIIQARDERSFADYPVNCEDDREFWDTLID